MYVKLVLKLTLTQDIVSLCHQFQAANSSLEFPYVKPYMGKGVSAKFSLLRGKH